MTEPNANIPTHIAIIMDGNGRWARKRAMPRKAGHRAGVKAVNKIVEYAAEKGVKQLTLFAFSSENWSRPREEVSALMKLFFDALQREVEELHRNKVRLTFVGDRARLQPALVEKIELAENQTAENDGLTLIVAVAYGGRWDIVNSAQRLAMRVKNNELQPEDIDETSISSELQLAQFPDPDLLIRTGGEQRISNFLLWNLAYTELWFTDHLWPDFGPQDLDDAIEHFAQRQRRFGHTGDQVGVV